MAAARMNPKTLQYLMGHSDIGVTLNVYTHSGLDNAKEELARLREVKADLQKTNNTNATKVNQNFELCGS